MFKPNYSITPDMLNSLIKTAEAKALLDNAYFVPKWEVALRREALIKNAHASTVIEGNPLSLEQVSELAMGRDIMAARKAQRQRAWSSYGKRRKDACMDYCRGMGKRIK